MHAGQFGLSENGLQEIADFGGVNCRHRPWAGCSHPAMLWSWWTTCSAFKLQCDKRWDASTNMVVSQMISCNLSWNTDQRVLLEWQKLDGTMKVNSNVGESCISTSSTSSTNSTLKQVWVTACMLGPKRWQTMLE